MLASIRAELGGLERLERLIKTVGFVSSTPDFQQQPQVINGFSELLCQLLGDEAGVGARSAVGVAALPAGWAVEVEAVFQISS